VKVLYKTLLVVIVCAIGFLAGVGATYYATEKQANISMANLVLHDLSGNLELAEMVNDSNVDMAAIKLQQNKNFAVLILTVSALHPEVDKLDSISLESLCKTAQLSNNGMFDDPRIGEIRILAKEYLNNINGQVSNRIAELQKLFKGKGCKVEI
jgi:hypothetical protein